MSLEIIQDTMEQLKGSHKADFSSILQEVINYGFVDDVDLAKLFKIDLVDLEDILDDSSNLSHEEWNLMVNRLYKTLKKESKAYSHLYYADR